jgi:hypothetical protein
MSPDRSLQVRRPTQSAAGQTRLFGLARDANFLCDLASWITYSSDDGDEASRV